MKFRSPRTVFEAECLRGLTGAILSAIAETLKVAPCRNRTDCLGGIDGKGFLRSIQDFLALIGNARESFHQRLLYVHYYQQAGYKFFPPTQEGCANQYDLEVELFDGGFEVWADSHDNITTTRLAIAVMNECPGRVFSEYVAESFPEEVVDTINITLYYVLVLACQKACPQIEGGRKELLLQFTPNHPVIVI